MLTEQLHGGGTVGVAAESSNAHVDLSPISFFEPGLEALTAQVENRPPKIPTRFPWRLILGNETACLATLEDFQDASYISL